MKITYAIALLSLMLPGQVTQASAGYWANDEDDLAESIGRIAPPEIDHSVLTGGIPAGYTARSLSVKSVAIALTGDGTADDPYQIGSAADWNTLAEYVNTDSATLTGQHVLLTADIDFSSASIVALSAFDGDLDGNGKTLKGITKSLSAAYTSPVIATALENAVVHDLSVEGTVTASYSYTGTVVGVLYGKLSNVSGTVALTGAGSYCVSGLVGYAGAGSSISDCTFDGSLVSQGYYSAGIVGYAYYSTIERCVNKAAITANYAESGGIVSYAVGSAITDCVNYGSITGVGTYCYYYGGIVCWSRATTISGCVNNGDITEPNDDDGYSGGIAAVADTLCVITSCTNNGTLSFAGPYCGGIVGYNQYAEMSQCTNIGTVTAAAMYSGGIVGYIKETTLTGCSNSGTVTLSGKYGGGCIGYAWNVDISCCLNDSTGSVSSTGEYSGGVIGRLSGGTIADCENRGAMTSTKLVAGGVIGNINSSSGYRCVNYGEVNVSGQYGAGVIGSASKSLMSDFVNETSGTVTASKKNSSGVLGNATTDTISGFINRGTVLYSGTTEECYIGGVFGKCTSCVISDCANEGSVSSTNTSASHIAGVTPSIASGTTVMTRCYNTADIGAYGYAAGIVAYCASGAVVQVADCYNAGDISVATSYAAGILAYGVTAGTVTGCFNTGDITASTSCAGGIAGYSPSAFSSVYNCGTITGGDNVGGLIGGTVAGSTSLATGYSAGTVAATGTAGNVLGVSTSDTGSWTDGNSMSATYYLADNAVDCVDAYSTAVTRSWLATVDLGSDWTAGDSYTYPRITAVADNDYACAYAATVIPADGDGYSSITQNFSVGTPDGVEWTATPDAVTVDGNTAAFNETFDGTLTMTATCGQVSVSTELVCNVEVDGIDDAVTGAVVVDERLYTPSGRLMARPVAGRPAVYIVVSTYSDGTVAVIKEAR